jgi:hypothetical protein
VAFEHGLGDVEHPPAGGARMVAQQLERLPLADAVALHQDALGTLDHRAPIERGLELGDLLVEPLLLAMAPHRDVDRPLNVLRLPRIHVAGDPHVGRVRDGRRVLGLAHGHEHRPGRERHGLGDQRQPVLVVPVEDDERQVGILACDQLRRLGDGHRERRHLVPELIENVTERSQVLLAFVGEKDPKVTLARSP